MDTKIVLQEIEEVVDMELGSLRGNESLDDLPNWDSLAFLSFLAMAESRFGVKVAPETLRAARSVTDLYAILAPGLDECRQTRLNCPVA